jgi:anti-sigma factor RsiW
MCDWEDRLVAWLDRELPEGEADDVSRHLEMCAECRKQAEAYKRTSIALSAYCDAVSRVHERHPRTFPPKMAVLGAGAVAAVVVFAFLARYPHRPVTNEPLRAMEEADPRPSVGKVANSPASPSHTGPVKASSTRRGRRRDLIAASQKQDGNLVPTGPAVEITIPAEAVLPPGAAPAGESFLVEMTIAPDGSTEGIRVRAQLTGFERTQP